MIPYSMEYLRKKVVIYARVSTDHDAQLSALENQIDWYKPILDLHPEWELVCQYIDATDIIGLKQNPTNRRRFSPIFSFIGHFRYKTRKCYF